MRMFDYTCTSCGHTEQDVLIKNNEDVVLCTICNTAMDQQFPACTIKTPPRHHHSLKGYKPGRGNVNFGRLKDL